MRTIIIYHPNKKDRDYLSLQWEAAFDVEIKTVESLVDAVRMLVDAKDLSNIILVIKTNNDGIDAEVLKFISDHPTLSILTDSFELEDLKKSNSEHRIVNVSQFYNLKNIATILKAWGVNSSRKNDIDAQFCKINFYNFLQFNSAVTDIFIKLGPGNFVKIVHAGELFTREILTRYQSKDVRYLYIKSVDAELFMSEAAKILGLFYENENLTDNILKEVHLASIDNISRQLKLIGVNDQVVELAQKTTLSVIQSFRSMPRLWDYLIKKTDHSSFLSEQSLMVSVLSCAISENLDWKTDYTLKKLTYAALLRDIALEDTKLCFIRSQQDQAFKELSYSAKKLFLNHPQQALAMLKGFPELPSGVDSIILEHHERPSGSGFPKKLNSYNISPLGCVLILAEEFYDLLHKKGFTIQARNEILQDLGEGFGLGNFKSPLNGLINLFITARGGGQ